MKQEELKAKMEADPKIPLVNYQDNFLIAFLVNKGPLVVAVDASDFDFKYYGSGSFICKSNTSGGKTNHVMLLVGYDEKSWILKNSWGDDWGVKGLMYMDRHIPNNC